MKHQDQRRFRRIVIAANPKLTEFRPCRIIDISLGGLSFHYLSTDEWPEWSNEWAKQLFGEDELCLDAIPMRTVSDSPIAQALDNRSTVMRRRGIQFERLRPYQRTMIKYFIWLKTGAA